MWGNMACLVGNINIIGLTGTFRAHSDLASTSEPAFAARVRRTMRPWSPLRSLAIA